MVFGLNNCLTQGTSGAILESAARARGRRRGLLVHDVHNDDDDDDDDRRQGTI